MTLITKASVNETLEWYLRLTYFDIFWNHIQHFFPHDERKKNPSIFKISTGVLQYYWGKKLKKCCLPLTGRAGYFLKIHKKQQIHRINFYSNKAHNAFAGEASGLNGAFFKIIPSPKVPFSIRCDLINVTTIYIAAPPPNKPSWGNYFLNKIVFCPFLFFLQGNCLYLSKGGSFKRENNEREQKMKTTY